MHSRASEAVKARPLKAGQEMQIPQNTTTARAIILRNWKKDRDMCAKCNTKVVGDVYLQCSKCPNRLCTTECIALHPSDKTLQHQNVRFFSNQCIKEH